MDDAKAHTRPGSAATRSVDPTRPRPALRFGVLCSGTSFPMWQAMCLRKLLALDNVELGMLIVDEETSGLFGALREFRHRRQFSRILWYIYSAFSRLSWAMRRVDMSRELEGVPVIRCRVHYKGKYSQYFAEKDIEDIRKQNLDFALRFGFNIIRGEILKVARYGVWSFHHDDEEKYRGSPPGFWEVYSGDPVTGAMLQRLTDRLDSGIVLKKGFYKTVLGSYVRNRDRGFLDSTDWPAQVCVDITNGNTSHVEGEPSRTSAPIYRAPTNVQMLAFGFKVLRNLVVELATKLLYSEQWNIGVGDGPIEDFLETRTRPSVTWFPDPARSRFSADPFAVQHGGSVRVLFEDFHFLRAKGVIASVTVQGRDSSEAEVVLEEPFHMSHPYLIEHDGEVYCIPETCEADKVVLYRAVDFPARWARVATLIDGFAGVDATVIRRDGRWWLFATDQRDGPDHKLTVWHAPTLTGPWEPHELNPVKIDVRSARPAGTPFVRDGQLFRPAQDCSKVYGGGVTINRVVTLTPHEFEETPVVVVEAYRDSRYSDGIHTLSAVADKVIVDGMRRVFVGRNPAMAVYKVRRVFQGRRV
jgi:hypothetical protein